MIETETVVYKEESELKKAEKLLEHDKKMILMRYKNQSIYQLYDRESDSVIISESIDFNEDLLKLITRIRIFCSDSVLFQVRIRTEQDFFSVK